MVVDVFFLILILDNRRGDKDRKQFMTLDQEPCFWIKN